MNPKETIFSPDELVPPDPVGDAKAAAGCLPADRENHSDDGKKVTDHDDTGWRSARWWKP